MFFTVGVGFVFQAMIDFLNRNSGGVMDTESFLWMLFYGKVKKKKQLGIYSTIVNVHSHKPVISSLKKKFLKLQVPSID